MPLGPSTNCAGFREDRRLFLHILSQFGRHARCSMPWAHGAPRSAASPGSMGRPVGSGSVASLPLTGRPPGNTNPFVFPDHNSGGRGSREPACPGQLLWADGHPHRSGAKASSIMSYSRRATQERRTGANPRESHGYIDRNGIDAAVRWRTHALSASQNPVNPSTAVWTD